MNDIDPIIEILKSMNAQFKDWHDHLGQYDKSSYRLELTKSIVDTNFKEMLKRTQRWPAVGDKIVAVKNEIKAHWFTNVIENAKKLEIGKFYTVKKCNPASSWCPVEIEEIEGTFCLNCFEWKY